jgi:Zn finger protein HypA/HybF involved in hydrogenase expression
MDKMINSDNIIEYCNFVISVLTGHKQSVAALRRLTKNEILMLIGHQQSVTVSVLRQIINYVKDEAIEAEPVHRGRWIDGWICSECKGGSREPNTLFCPNCGAKMDGGAADEQV